MPVLKFRYKLSDYFYPYNPDNKVQEFLQITVNFLAMGKSMRRTIKAED